ncbi:hypothetical protein [Flavobacterium sp. SORGH_AS_0622]|uniref:hypothetical protein n=1 Tax=Flavobacterium sp. SORGH_AS_0622 TaxID=3041772 RepID=UPI002784C5E7|nr:hypothetical protein [Flavobacterium sp. SORGH_AS_0622]MDQ1166481.1 hypothetical protein [Flavobacterium sp. SORGH_AS_0622]
MKIAAASPVIPLFKKINIESGTNSADEAFRIETQKQNLLTDLYSRSDDEPDFDCEFLDAAYSCSENENVIDLESQDELTDLFNDNQWDAEIYDPYLESTYY